jgi:hypothetical protein
VWPDVEIEREKQDDHRDEHAALWVRIDSLDDTEEHASAC